MIKNLKNFNFKERLANVERVILPLEGVLVSPQLLVSDNKVTRSINFKDYYLLEMAVRNNVDVVISSDNTEVAKNLFPFVKNFVLQKDVIEALSNANVENVLALGNCISDYDLLLNVGLPIASSDACEDVKNISLYVCNMRGGKGSVSDIMEQVLRAKDLWLK